MTIDDCGVRHITRQKVFHCFSVTRHMYTSKRSASGASLGGKLSLGGRLRKIFFVLHGKQKIYH
jgi:hypothetical protein